MDNLNLLNRNNINADTFEIIILQQEIMNIIDGKKMDKGVTALIACLCKITDTLPNKEIKMELIDFIEERLRIYVTDYANKDE